MEQENVDSMILMENDTTMEILQNISCDDCKNIMCFNESDYAEYESWVSVDEFEMFAISLNIIVFVAGIMGNLLVFIAVTTTKSMQSVTNIFIVNLAMADMLVMLFCAPPSVIWDVTNTWFFGSLMCKIVIYIQDISVSVSVFTLTFIAYDRYNAICRPLQFSSRKTNAALVITIIWSVSAIIGIPDAVTLELFKPLNLQDDPCVNFEEVIYDMARCQPKWSVEIDMIFLVIKGILLYTLPLIFMCVAYYYIFKTLWRRTHNLPTGLTSDTSETTFANPSCNVGGGAGSNNHQDSSSRNTTGSVSTGTNTYSNGQSGLANRSTMRVIRFGIKSQNAAQESSSNSAVRNLDNQLRTRRKVAKMLIAVVIMFFINYFPVYFFPVLQYLVGHNEHMVQFFHRIAILNHFMCYFNSAINPIIYYFMSAQFKTQYRRILCCRCTTDSPRVATNNHRVAQPQKGLTIPSSNAKHSTRQTQNNAGRHHQSARPEELPMISTKNLKVDGCSEYPQTEETQIH